MKRHGDENNVSFFLFLLTHCCVCFRFLDAQEHVEEMRYIREQEQKFFERKRMEMVRADACLPLAMLHMMLRSFELVALKDAWFKGVCRLPFSFGYTMHGLAELLRMIFLWTSWRDPCFL